MHAYEKKRSPAQSQFSSTGFTPPTPRLYTQDGNTDEGDGPCTNSSHNGEETNSGMGALILSETDWQRFETEAEAKYKNKHIERRPVDDAVEILCCSYYLNKSKTKKISVLINADKDFEALIKLEGIKGDFLYMTKTTWEKFSKCQMNISSYFENDNRTCSQETTIMRDGVLEVTAKDMYGRKSVAIKTLNNSPGACVSQTVFIQGGTWKSLVNIWGCINISLNQKQLWQSEIISCFNYYSAELANLFSNKSNYYFTKNYKVQQVTEFVKDNIYNVYRYYAGDDDISAPNLNCVVVEAEIKALCTVLIARRIMELLG